MITVFVGYDPREDLSFRVCKHSIETACPAARVFPIDHREMRRLGLFSRRWRIDENGQGWDEDDGRPFSTEFAFTRFLAPVIGRLLGEKVVLFCDSDFVFMEDVSKLFALFDPAKAVQVVQFNYNPPESRKKDQHIQSPYNRKLWSSLTLWNVNHPSNAQVTVDKVNSATGKHLHGFEWLKPEEIGALPPEWNFVPGVSDPNLKPKAVHYSLGGPWLEQHEAQEYAYLWLMTLARMHNPKAFKSRLFPAFDSTLLMQKASS